MKKNIYKAIVLCLCLTMITGCSSTPPTAVSIAPLVEGASSSEVTQKEPTAKPEPEPVKAEPAKLSTVRISIDPSADQVSLLDKLVFPMTNGKILSIDSKTPITSYSFSSNFNGELRIGPIRKKRATENTTIISQRLNSWDAFSGVGEDLSSTLKRRYAITTMYADNTFLVQVDELGIAALVQDYLPKAVWDKVSDPQNFIDEGVSALVSNATMEETPIESYIQNIVVNLGDSVLLNKENFPDLSEIAVTPKHLTLTFSTGDVFSIYLGSNTMGPQYDNIKIKSGTITEEWGKIAFTGGTYLGQTICYSKRLSDQTVITVVSDNPTGGYTIDLKQLAETLGV